MSDWVWVPFHVDVRFDGYRVDRFLAQRLIVYSRGRIQRILGASRVMRGERLMKASARVRGGEKIFIAYPRHPEVPLAADASLPILYEDDDLIVINKPADLLSHPTDKISQHTVLGVLRHARPDLKALHLLHRLDRETSGALALGKTGAAARAWCQTMEGGQVKKQYLAVVQGVPHPRQGILDRPIGRQEGTIKVRQWVDVPGAVSAITRYEVIRSLTPDPSPGGRGENSDVFPLPPGEGGRRPGEASLVRLFPETGRLHQIRVHMAAIGHPLLGDVLYNGDGSLYLKMTRHELTAADRASVGFARVALHAAVLQFPHPIRRTPLTISAPLPPDLSDFLQTREIAKIDTLTAS